MPLWSIATPEIISEERRIGIKSSSFSWLFALILTLRSLALSGTSFLRMLGYTDPWMWFEPSSIVELILSYTLLTWLSVNNLMPPPLISSMLIEFIPALLLAKSASVGEASMCWVVFLYELWFAILRVLLPARILFRDPYYSQPIWYKLLDFPVWPTIGRYIRESPIPYRSSSQLAVALGLAIFSTLSMSPVSKLLNI